MSASMETLSNVLTFVPKSMSRRERQCARGVAAGSSQRKAERSDIMLAQKFIAAARQADAEGDRRLAEHLLEIAYDIFDGR